MSKLLIILLATVTLSACAQPKSSYQRWQENKPKSYSGIYTHEQGKDFHKYMLRQRCKQAYSYDSYECLEMYIWGD